MVKVDPAELKKQFEPKETKTLKTDRQLCAIRFTPDGKLLFGGGCDSRVWRWDVGAKSPKELPAWDNGGGWVQCVEVHPNGKTLFTADSWGLLQAWNPSGDKPKTVWSNKTAHDGWIHGLAVNANGSLLATTGIDGRVKVWSAADGELKHDFKEHAVESFAVAFHPKDNALVSGDLRGRVKQWDVATGKKTREFDSGVLYKEHRLQEVGGARVLAFDPKGEQLFVGGTQPKNGGNVQGTPTILVFNWKTGKLEHTLELGKTSDVYVCAIEYHPAGFVMAAISGGPGIGKLVFQRLEDKEPFFTTTKYRNCHSMSLRADRKRFVVTTTNNGSNGNGRRLKNGEYVGNHSPVHIFDFPAS